MDNTIHNVTLTGHPEFLPDKLLMRYDVTNRGATDVYVVDGVPAVDQSSRKAAARNAPRRSTAAP